MPSSTQTPVACVSKDNRTLLAQLDGRSLEQRDLVVREAKSALKAKRLTKKEADKYIGSAKSLYVVSWTAVWTIPSFVTECDQAQTCITVSLQSTIDSFASKSNDLRNLANTMASKIKSRGGKKQAESITKRARTLHDHNIAELKTLPTTNTSCS